MKRALLLLLVMAALLSLAGCGSKADPAETAAPAPVSATPEPAPVPTETPEPEGAAPEKVDVDLTQLSSTMVYSEVYAMVYEPEQYLGKTVRMKGLFATQEYNGARLYACIVQDATACCAQGLEFEPADKLAFPEDFPEPGAEITVQGTFDTYREDAGNGNSYVYLVLRNASLV